MVLFTYIPRDVTWTEPFETEWQLEAFQTRILSLWSTVNLPEPEKQWSWAWSDSLNVGPKPHTADLQQSFKRHDRERKTTKDPWAAAAFLPTTKSSSGTKTLILWAAEAGSHPSRGWGSFPADTAKLCYHFEGPSEVLLLPSPSFSFPSSFPLPPPFYYTLHTYREEIGRITYLQNELGAVAVAWWIRRWITLSIHW